MLLGNKYTRSTHFFDLSFCSSTEKLCFHYNWLLREVTFTKYFVVTLWGGKKTENVSDGNGEREKEKKTSDGDRGSRER